MLTKIKTAKPTVDMFTWVQFLAMASGEVVLLKEKTFNIH
jgi:hypothetical protein